MNCSSRESETQAVPCSHVVPSYRASWCRSKQHTPTTAKANGSSVCAQHVVCPDSLGTTRFHSTSKQPVALQPRRQQQTPTNPQPLQQGRKPVGQQHRGVLLGAGAVQPQPWAPAGARWQVHGQERRAVPAAQHDGLRWRHAPPLSNGSPGFIEVLLLPGLAVCTWGVAKLGAMRPVRHEEGNCMCGAGDALVRRHFVLTGSLALSVYHRFTVAIMELTLGATSLCLCTSRRDNRPSWPTRAKVHGRSQWRDFSAVQHYLGCRHWLNESATTHPTAISPAARLHKPHSRRRACTTAAVLTRSTPWAFNVSTHSATTPKLEHLPFGIQHDPAESRPRSRVVG